MNLQKNADKLSAKLSQVIEIEIEKFMAGLRKALDKRYPNAIENVEWWWANQGVLDITVSFKEDAIDSVPEDHFDDWDGLDARLHVTLDIDLGQ